MTMLPCVEDWNKLTPWNLNSRSWYCLATQISRLLMVSEGSYTTLQEAVTGLCPKLYSVHTLPQCFFKHFNIILPHVSGCFKWFCPSVFPTEIYAFLCVLRAKCPAHFVLFCLCHPNNVLWKGQRIRVTRILCCMCVVSVSVSDRSWFQFLNHLIDVHGILCGNYATGGRSNPKFPTHTLVTTWRTPELVRWEVW